MSIDPKDMVNHAAQLLKSNSAEEVHLRGLIHLAYYGSFLRARSVSGNDNFRGKDVHGTVADHFKTSDEVVHNNLGKLHWWRKQADYRPDKTITFTDARKSCNAARSIIDSLEEPL